MLQARRELKLHDPFSRGLRAREEMDVDARAIRENSARWDGRGRPSLHRSGTGSGGRQAARAGASISVVRCQV